MLRVVESSASEEMASIGAMASVVAGRGMRVEGLTRRRSTAIASHGVVVITSRRPMPSTIRASDQNLA